MDGQMDRQMDGQIDGQVYKWIDKQLDGQIDRWIRNIESSLKFKKVLKSNIILNNKVFKIDYLPGRGFNGGSGISIARNQQNMVVLGVRRQRVPSRVNSK